MLESSSAYYRQQQELAALALIIARNSWDRIDTGDITGSWEPLTDSLAAALAIIQYRAAVQSVDYIGNALAEQGIDAPAEAEVQPRALVGVAAYGGPLDGLLDRPRITTLTELKSGTTLSRALEIGRQALERIAITQIQDAGRVAAGVEIVNRPDVTGYVRVLNPPSCSRCILLAGKRYKWNQGFARHPRCDCRHVPVSERYGAPQNVAAEALDPKRYFDSLPKEKTFNDKGQRIDQDAIFGEAGAKAIRDGADISAVVNVRQGISTAGTYGHKTTTVGTTKKSLAGQRLGAGKGRRVERLMPESIYQLAGEDRREAMRLLYLHGYVL